MSHSEVGSTNLGAALVKFERKRKLPAKSPLQDGETAIQGQNNGGELATGFQEGPCVYFFIGLCSGHISGHISGTNADFSKIFYIRT